MSYCRKIVAGNVTRGEGVARCALRVGGRRESAGLARLVDPVYHA
jgi:hypothetical protein